MFALISKGQLIQGETNLCDISAYIVNVRNSFSLTTLLCENAHFASSIVFQLLSGDMRQPTPSKAFEGLLVSPGMAVAILDFRSFGLETVNGLVCADGCIKAPEVDVERPWPMGMASTTSLTVSERV